MLNAPAEEPLLHAGVAAIVSVFVLAPEEEKFKATLPISKGRPAVSPTSAPSTTETARQTIGAVAS